MQEEADSQSMGTIEVLHALGNPVRKSVVTALASRHVRLRFSELMEASGLDPNFDTGQFWHHLSELMRRGIVIKDEVGYGLSQFGVKLSKILDTVDRECSFLLKKREDGGGLKMEDEFQIRRYEDTDFDEAAELVKDMYHYYWVELLHGEEMSLEYARHTVATDLLVPGTYVYVAEDLETKKLAGFVSYNVTHGGAFFVDYLWVRKQYLSTGLREALLGKVEEDVREAREDQYHVRIGVRDKLYGQFFVSQGFDTLNQLEITKYLEKPPEREYSAENVDAFGYRFRRVI